MAKIFKRRLVREKVLQVLYAFELNNEQLQKHIDEIFIEIKDEIDKDFGSKLVYRCVANQNIFDQMIAEKISNWEIERVAIIDRILLRMGICEFMFFDDIPPKVTINEIIEISKKFSTEGSSKFLNGVLDSILYYLIQSNKLKKTGRGLLDESITKSPPDETDKKQ